MKTHKHPKNHAGFTLIELLVVVVLLGILSGIAVFAVGNARDKAIVEACRSQQAQLLKALDLYYIDNNGVWPPTTATPTGPNADTTLSASYTFVQLAPLVPKYLKQLPPYSGDGVATADKEFSLQASIVPSSGSGATKTPAFIRITETNKTPAVCSQMPR